MALLTGPAIEKYHAEGWVKIKPFDAKHAGPNSFDVHLGDTIRVYDIAPGVPIDPHNPPKTREYPLDEQGRWLLMPHTGYLAVIRERVECHGLVPYLDGRSSIGRYFVTIHQTAGRGDDGWGGYFTCEIVVTSQNPVYLRPGDKIGQITFHTLEGERREYDGRYKDQPAEPVASRFHEG